MQIEALGKSKKELVEQLLSIKDLTKGEQIQNILDYGSHYNWIIDFTYGGILEDYVADRDRHTTIELHDVLDNIGYYYAPTFEEHLEVLKMFGIEKDFTKDKFDYFKEGKYSKERSMKDFEDLWNDIVKGGVSSFRFDW